VGIRVFSSRKPLLLAHSVRTVLAAAAFIAMVVVVLGGPASARGVGHALGIRWIPLAVAVGALLILVVWRPKVVSNPGLVISRVPSTSPTSQEILDARLQDSLKYSAEVQDLFSRMLRNSSRYTTRAVEDVQVLEGCLRLQVVMEYAFNDDSLVMKIRDSGKPVLLLPLIKLSKDATLDNLDIRDGDDRHVSPLLQDELYGLLANVIENLFRSAYINGTAEGPLRELTQIEEAVLQSLIQVVCNPEKINKSDIASAIGVLGSIGGRGSDPVNKAAAEYLESLCEFFAQNYLIVVEADLPRGNRLSMKYSRTVPLYEQTAYRGDRIRVRLGLSPRSFTLPMTLPFEAPSYHFTLAGVPGGFAARQLLLEASAERQIIKPGQFSHEQVQPFLSSKCESALPYTHFHTRGLQRLSPIDMWTRVDFDEVPPGALGGALAVSAVSAMLIWFFTLVQPGLHANPSVASDLPALLLAVPAFVATWIGASVDRVLRSSISTYFGLGVSTAVSLASAVLYIANSDHKELLAMGRITIDHGLVRLQGVDATWLALALIASFTSAYLAEKLRNKMAVYMRLLENDRIYKGGH
jgi:hypothetical protein